MSRWVFRPDHPKASRFGMVPVADLGDFDEGDKRVMVMTDFYMDGAHSQDGVDIGSRRKRKQFMQARGLADASDYSDDWRARKRASDARETKQDIHRDVVEAFREGRKP